MPNLTKTRLEAIIEGLHNSLAGAIDGDISRQEYEKALEWAQDMLDNRQAAATLPKSRRFVRKVVPPLTAGREQ
jgi:hypothetical protein